MKRIMSFLLLAVMLLSLSSCVQSEEAATEISEEDKLRFYEEISTEQKELSEARLADLMSGLYGEWRMEFTIGKESDSVFANEILLNEDMTYEYGRQTGTWYFDEEEEEIRFINSEDGVRYFTFTILEEDGYGKLLCEGEYCYVREEDYRDIFAKKYVMVLRAMAPEYFGEPQYVGTVSQDMGYGYSGQVCVLDSLAYENGLIYLGYTSPFEMEVVREMKDGSTVTDILSAPFAFMSYLNGSRIVSIRIESGMAYFVRSEYVEEVVIDEDGNRKVVLKTGAVFYDYSCPIWEYFPETPYDDFKF